MSKAVITKRDKLIELYNDFKKQIKHSEFIKPENVTLIDNMFPDLNVVELNDIIWQIRLAFPFVITLESPLSKEYLKTLTKSYIEFVDPELAELSKLITNFLILFNNII